MTKVKKDPKQKAKVKKVSKSKSKPTVTVIKSEEKVIPVINKKVVPTIKPVPKGMMELRVRHSLTLIYLHKIVCVSLGKCLCKVEDGKRVPKVEHLHPGILYIVPKIMLSHNPLKKLRRKGKIFPKI